MKLCWQCDNEVSDKEVFCSVKCRKRATQHPLHDTPSYKMKRIRMNRYNARKRESNMRDMPEREESK